MMRLEADFFRELDRGLLRSEYTDRLKTELAAHIEDATYVKTVAGTREEEARRESLESLGSPQEVKHSFNTVMRMRQTNHLYLEAFFISVVSIPFAAVAHIFEFSFLEMTLFSLLPGGITYGQWVSLVPATLLALFIMPVFYLVTLPRLLRFADERAVRLKVAAIVLSFPVLMSVIWNIPMVAVGPWPDWLLSIISAAVIPIVIDSLSLVLIVWLWGRLVTRAAKGPTRLRRSLPLSLPAVLSVVAIVYLVFAAGVRWTGRNGFIDPSLPPFSWALLPFNLISVYVTMFVGFGLELFPSWYVIAIWSTGLVLAAVGVYAAVEIVRFMRDRNNKKEKSAFPWFQTVALVYVIIVFVIHSGTAPILYFEQPAAEVSADIERRMLGPFVPFARDLDDYIARLTFEVASAADGFEVKHEWSGARYIITDIGSPDNFALRRVPGVFDPMSAGGEGIATWKNLDGTTDVVLPGLTCTQAPEVGMQTSLGVMDAQGLIMEVEYQGDAYPLCTVLAYQGTTIYTTDQPSYVMQAAVTPDDRWLLLKLAADPYVASDYIYLVELP